MPASVAVAHPPPPMKPVKVVSTGAVVDIPRRVAARDSGAGSQPKPRVPKSIPQAIPDQPPARESKSWFQRVFDGDIPPAPLKPDAYIRVAVDRGAAVVSIDGVDRGPAPFIAFVNAGHHTVSVRGSASYAAPTTGVVVSRGDTMRVLFHATRTP